MVDRFWMGGQAEPRNPGRSNAEERARHVLCVTPDWGGLFVVLDDDVVLHCSGRRVSDRASWWS